MTFSWTPKLARVLAVVAVLIVALAGVHPKDARAGATVEVKVANYSFSALPPIDLGTTVTWTVTEGDHTATSDGASFDSGPMAKDSSPHSYSYTFTKPGRYIYRCSFHATTKNMSGVVEVRGAPGETTTTEPPTTTTTWPLYRPPTTTTTTTTVATTATTAPAATPTTQASTTTTSASEANPAWTAPAGGSPAAPEGWSETTSSTTAPAPGARRVPGAVTTTAPAATPAKEGAPAPAPPTTTADAAPVENTAPPSLATEASPAPASVATATGRGAGARDGGSVPLGAGVAALGLVGGGSYGLTRRRRHRD